MIEALEAHEKRRPAMKKISTVQILGNEIFKEQKLTIGVDLGDRWSFYCVLDEAGKIILEQKVATTPEAMKQTFGKIPRSLIALETGTHSPWASRRLTELGHEVLVAHAQKVALITKSNRKDDRHDARTLARLARIDPELLGPVRHRSAKAQIHLTVIRARAELVSARTALVNAARGLVKSYGQRLPKCGTQQVNRELAVGLSTELREVLQPLLKEIESRNERIPEYDERMEKIAQEVYPEVSLLKQVKGVGTQIALTYVLTIEDPYRFEKSREVGCFLGLKPGRRNSRNSEPQKWFRQLDLAPFDRLIWPRPTGELSPSREPPPGLVGTGESALCFPSRCGNPRSLRISISGVSFHRPPFSFFFATFFFLCACLQFSTEK
jgi:transposase